MIDDLEIGLGTAALALANRSEADRTLCSALDNGVEYFDVSPLYGGGNAEVRLGEVLKKYGSANVAVSTKVGRYRDLGAAPPQKTGKPDTWDFSEKTVRASIERSCERIGRDFLDCVFLHDIEGAQESALCEALPVLKDLQQRGVVGKVGAGCNTVAGLIAAIKAGAADAVLVAGRWTVLDRSGEKTLLPLCAAHNTQVIAGGVLNSGLLAKRPVDGASFDYRPATPAERLAATELHDIAHEFGVSLISAALQFPTRHPTVKTLLLGVSSNDQLSLSLAALKTKIPSEFWEAVKAKGMSL